MAMAIPMCAKNSFAKAIVDFNSTKKAFRPGDLEFRENDLIYITDYLPKEQCYIGSTNGKTGKIFYTLVKSIKSDFEYFDLSFENTTQEGCDKIIHSLYETFGPNRLLIIDDKNNNLRLIITNPENSIDESHYMGFRFLQKILGFDVGLRAPEVTKVSCTAYNALTTYEDQIIDVAVKPSIPREIKIEIIPKDKQPEYIPRPVDDHGEFLEEFTVDIKFNSHVPMYDLMLLQDKVFTQLFSKLKYPNIDKYLVHLSCYELLPNGEYRISLYISNRSLKSPDDSYHVCNKIPDFTRLIKDFIAMSLFQLIRDFFPTKFEGSSNLEIRHWKPDSTIEDYEVIPNYFADQFGATKESSLIVYVEKKDAILDTFFSDLKKSGFEMQDVKLKDDKGVKDYKAIFISTREQLQTVISKLFEIKLQSGEGIKFGCEFSDQINPEITFSGKVKKEGRFFKSIAINFNDKSYSEKESGQLVQDILNLVCNKIISPKDQAFALALFFRPFVTEEPVMTAASSKGDDMQFRSHM